MLLLLLVVEDVRCGACSALWGVNGNGNRSQKMNLTNFSITLGPRKRCSEIHTRVHELRLLLADLEIVRQDVRDGRSRERQPVSVQRGQAPHLGTEKPLDITVDEFN